MRVNKISEFKSTPAIGMAAHKVFQAKKGLREQTIKGFGRADGMTSKHVIELKPNNPRAIAKGMKQLERYSKGSGKPGQLWVYSKNKAGKFVYKCSRGC